MADISTKDLIEEYYSTRKEDEKVRTQGQVDRPEVYEYEEEIGKQLIEMDDNELLELISRFNNRNAKDKSKGMSYLTYRQISSIYRNIWNYYIDNYKIIKNPWNSKTMRGENAMNSIFKTKKRFTKKDFDDIIDRLYVKCKENEDRAVYFECIMQLFYNGIEKAEDIVTLKDDQIVFRTHEIRLDGRTVKLSDRCFSLLCQVHNMKIMKNVRGDCYMLPWHDGYFKFIVRPSNLDNYNDYDVKYMAASIHKKLSSEINTELKVSINYKLLYYLGLYDKLCEKLGEERTDELIVARRKPECTKELLNAVSELGYYFDNPTYLKENLRAYVAN